jgi:hypothetical protein
LDLDYVMLCYVMLCMLSIGQKISVYIYYHMIYHLKPDDLGILLFCHRHMIGRLTGTQS